MGKSIVTPNHVYTKLGNGTIRDLTLDTNTVYTHPSTKQCNYYYTHPATKQCNYNVDLSNYVTKGEATNYIIRAGSGTERLNSSTSSSFNGSDTFTVSFDQMNTVIGLVITGRLYDSRNGKYNPCGMCVQSINNNSATIACGYEVCFGTSWNPSVTYNYIVIGK